MRDKISIREVTKSMGLTTRTLRYYEEIGIIESIQTGRGNRNYDKKAIEKLVYLDELKNKGCSLKEIEDFMGDRCCNQKKELFEIRIKENQREIEYLIWQNKKILEEMEIIKKLNINNISMEIQELEAEFFLKTNEKVEIKRDNKVEKIWNNEEYDIKEEKIYCLNEKNLFDKNYSQYDFYLSNKNKDYNYEIPKGEYLVVYSREGIEKQDELFRKILEYINENKLVTEGNLYIWNKFRIFCKKEKKIILITKNIIKLKKN